MKLKVKKLSAVYGIIFAMLFASGCGKLTKDSYVTDADANSGMSNGSIQGVLLDNNAQPVAGATITLVKTDQIVYKMESTYRNLAMRVNSVKSAAVDTNLITITSNADGSFFSPLVQEGTYRLTAIWGTKGVSVQSIKVLADQITNVGELVLNKNGSISGTVDIVDLTDESDVMIGLLGISPIVFSNATGAYSITNVPSGVYDLAIIKQGYITTTRNVIITSGMNTVISKVTLSVDPYFQPPLKPVITGVANGGSYTSILDINAQQVSGVTFSAYIDDSEYTLGTPYAVVGSHVIKVTATKLLGGQSASATLNFSIHYGSITGKILDSNLAALSNVTIKLVNAASSEIWSGTSTDQNGSYTLVNVPDATYNMIATYNNLAGTRSTIVVKNANSVNLGDLIIKTAGDISGTVDIEGTIDNSLAIVEVVGTGIKALTDFWGNYDLRNVAEGTYTVTVKKSGYNTLTIDNVHVTVGNTTQLSQVALQKSVSGWSPVGFAGFSEGGAYTGQLTFSGDTPYLIYRDVLDGSLDSDKASVMKYSSGAWQAVGPLRFTAGKAFDPSIDVYNGTAYIAYIDYANGDKLTVMRYNGSSWSTVGSAGFTSDAVGTPVIKVYNGTPYVAFQDLSNSGRVSVMRYTGTSWVAVGNTAFSVGAAKYLSFFIDNGVFYAAFADEGNGDMAVVMRSNGSNWVQVGASQGTAGTAFVSLYVYNSIPYIAYMDVENSWKATVKKYTGSGWETIGDAGFTPGYAFDVALSVYEPAAGYVVPCIAYSDSNFDYKAKVLKYNGAEWVDYNSQEAISQGEAHDISLYIYENEPYVAFTDYTNNYKATVMKFTAN